MRVRFWGVRGSIPTPGPTTVRYGGNTTCIEVRTDSGETLIFDGGSGIRELGLSLLGRLPVKCALFISHTHWDHIQGLPFFVPLFIPGNAIDIFGAFDPVYQKTLQSILTSQMEYCYFPVRANELKAKLAYADLREGQSVTVGAAEVTPILMNHPVLTYGYRIKADGKQIFFSGDHENLVNIYQPGEDGFDEYQALIDLKQQALISFAADSDLIIGDAQYTTVEYAAKIGWGHSTYNDWIAFAQAARARRLIWTHHDPTRTDAQLDQIAADLSGSLPVGIEFSMAREGLELEL